MGKEGWISKSLGVVKKEKQLLESNMQMTHSKANIWAIIRLKEKGSLNIRFLEKNNCKKLGCHIVKKPWMYQSESYITTK